MTLKPLVSIMINNYNYGRYLSMAIDSALNQTYRPIEVVVVDDGSTDESSEIIRSYGSRINPVFKSNGGQASAFNTGFQICKGEIICLLDADDVFMPIKSEQVVDEFEKLPQAQWLIHRMNHTDAEGAPIVVNQTLDDIMLHESGNYINEVKYKKFNKFIPATSALVFRRSLINRILPVPAELRITADNYLKFASLISAPVIVVNKLLSLQRIHGNNLFTNIPMNTWKRKQYREINYHIAKGLWKLDRRQFLSLRMLYSVFKSSMKDLDLFTAAKTALRAGGCLLGLIGHRNPDIPNQPETFL